MNWLVAAAVFALVILPRNRWMPPATAAPYLSALLAAEKKHNLPAGLLVRVAYQESRFREDIISGRVRSSAGALGIMQIVPRWHPGIDPLDPPAAIDYAGGYLRRLYNQFGDWRLALAAYNWGPGNLAKDLKRADAGSEWPTETKNYVSQIAADVGLA